MSLIWSWAAWTAWYVFDLHKSLHDGESRSHVRSCSVDAPEPADAGFEDIFWHEHVGGHITQLQLFAVECHLASLDGVAGSFVFGSVGGLVLTATVEHDFATLASK